MFSPFSIIALIVALTIHEFAHALTADRLGDPTPRSQNRLSLNPLNHLDPLGTIMLIFAHFGWGKPVQIDPYNLKNPKRDELLIALAGPTSNILLAIVFTLLTKFFPFLTSILSTFIFYNIVLAVFNLLPIPPLDGSKIFLNLLPEEQSLQWEEALNQYGPILLIILLFFPINGSNAISLIINPIIQAIYSLLNFIF